MKVILNPTTAAKRRADAAEIEKSRLQSDYRELLEKFATLDRAHAAQTVEMHNLERKLVALTEENNALHEEIGEFSMGHIRLEKAVDARDKVIAKKTLTGFVLDSLIAIGLWMLILLFIGRR